METKEFPWVAEIEAGERDSGGLSARGSLPHGWNRKGATKMTALLDAPVSSTKLRSAMAAGVSDLEVKSYLTCMQADAVRMTGSPPAGKGRSPELLASLEQERLMAWRQNLAKIRQAYVSQ